MITTVQSGVKKIYIKQKQIIANLTANFQSKIKMATGVKTFMMVFSDAKTSTVHLRARKTPNPKEIRYNSLL